MLHRFGLLGAAAFVGTGAVSASSGTADVTFSDQHAKHNRMVFVDELHLPDWGFVVVHHLVDSAQDTGEEPDGAVNFQVIGHSAALPPGTHRQVPVRLHEDGHHSLAGPVPAVGSGDHALLAMAHKDDPNDHKYTFTDGDGPYTDSTGAVTDLGIVTF